jgi:hypothetical protein
MEHYFPKKIIAVVLTPFIVVSMLSFWLLTQYLADEQIHPVVFVVITTMIVIGTLVTLFK